MPDTTLQIAESAKKVLAEASLKEAFEKQKADLLQQWVAAETTDARERCWYAYHAVLNLQTELHAQIQRGIRRQKQISKQEAK